MKEQLKTIYCCGCEKYVDAERVTGDLVYPHRPDLAKLVFWRCQTCRNFVGTHKGTDRPLGVIATTTMKARRMQIHALIDPLWRGGMIKRKKLYRIMSRILGYEYHTAETRSLAELDMVEKVARRVAEEIIKKGEYVEECI